MSFLAVLRYIHQNPVKAKIVKNIDGYLYSSYNEYIREGDGYADKEFALSMIDKDAFVEFHQEMNDVKFLDIDEQDARLSDKDAREIIKSVSNCDSSSEFQALTTKERDRCIGELKERGLSIRQISRLTGISFAIVRRI